MMRKSKLLFDYRRKQLMQKTNLTEMVSIAIYSRIFQNIPEYPEYLRISKNIQEYPFLA